MRDFPGVLLISIGNIAKNIVLIGDQLQLGQPIKGTHPGDSGQSILDYLLEGKDTIPENRGIFLKSIRNAFKNETTIRPPAHTHNANAESEEISPYDSQRCLIRI